MKILFLIGFKYPECYPTMTKYTGLHSSNKALVLQGLTTVDDKSLPIPPNPTK